MLQCSATLPRPMGEMRCRFCYMSFLTASRRFFYADMEAKLYSPSAYDAAQLMAGKRAPTEPQAVLAHVSCHQHMYKQHSSDDTGWHVMTMLFML